MKDRFKEARKAKKLTQAQLAEAMHISKSAVEAYEYGRAEISDRVIADTCRILGINEDWLRTGSGEMFRAIGREEEIAMIVQQLYVEDDPFRRKLIRLISDLTPDQVETLKEIAKELASEEEKGLAE